MATKAKESTIIGKEKKAPSSNSHITPTKRTTKPSTTTTTNFANKPNSTPSHKNTPNYLKPTITSRLEAPSSKHPKNNNDSPNNNKPSPIRRRSLDKPLSFSNLPRSSPRRSSISLINKNPNHNPSKPISDKTSKTLTLSNGKNKPLVTTKNNTKKTTTPSTSTKKVLVANKDHGHASVKSTKRTPEETTKKLNVETEQVKEVTSQEIEEVIKVENEEHKVHEVEHVIDVESEHEIEHVHELEIENSGPPHYQVDDERVISTVSEADEAEKEALEEKAKDEEHELEEDEINQDEGGNNNNVSDHQEKFPEGEVGVNDEGEGGRVIMIEDHKSENNDNEEEALEEEKEAVEKVEETKVEATPSKQQLGERKQGNNKESLSNDVIEETASKLLEARKNKVRALAGAFQTVIDHQTT